jgi:Gas vesicle synthesis protein GvpL/GvpF
MTDTVMTEATVAGSENCVWLYCVGSADLTLPADLTGVAGEALELIRLGGLTAVAGQVPVSEFGSQALHQNLEDLDWLACCAHAHHDVISEAAASGVVLPMRLATLYQSESGVTGLLSKRAEQLEAAIADLTGCAEYGLKGYTQRSPGGGQPGVNDAAKMPSPAHDAPTAPATANPGTAYLKKRRADLDAHEEERRVAAQAAEQLVRQVAALALGERQHPLHDKSLDPAAGDMILNVSYLVADEESKGFEKAVGDLAQSMPSLRLELTGPWPPYSFATVQDSTGQDRYED